MNPDTEALAKQLETSLMPAMAVLVRLCPNAHLPADLTEFHENCQMHLIASDPDSFAAARVTLEKFGADVTELTVGLGDNLWCWFLDEQEAVQALRFYNRLPAKMGRYKAK